MTLLYRCICIVLHIAVPCSAIAQSATAPLHIISTRQALDASIQARPDARLVKLTGYIPGLIVDVRYATANNFAHRVLYTNGFAPYMRSKPATALLQVQQALNKKGLGLKIYDAYRPYAITCSLWKYTPDRRYTANPKRGSQHNRAIAADLTIIDLATGRELDMGTGYDCFNDSAHHAFTHLPAQALANRRLLKGLMEQHGFNAVPTEWWHYHWRDKHYDVLDIPFADLDK